ncbi:MAG: hypothetical protein IPL53_03230 [Ignavibacteria bacterium]|nr:hypothetical protein [Ignavibacteria bacterium]
MIIKNIFKIVLTLFTALTLTSCTKDVPPELLSNKQKTQEKQEKPQMPDDSIHRNLVKKDNFHSTEEKSGESKDGMSNDEVVKYTSAADEADTKYQKSKSETDKKTCIEMQLKAANYLMFDADLPPRDKYKPALQRYRRVLELDPKNEEAMANKTEIEDIYKSMGKPIPN